MSALQLHPLLSHRLIIQQVSVQHAYAHTRIFYANANTHTHARCSMDAVVHAQHESTYDLMPEKNVQSSTCGLSTSPSPTHSRPAVWHTCMLQCTCACCSQACHVLTCMIGVFVSMHEWVGHLHIGWPRIPFNVNLSPSAFAAPSTSSCRGVQVGVNSAPASISPGPKELHSYSTSRAVMSNRKPRQDKSQRHLCESLKVVALKGRVFEVGETPALQLLFTCTLRLQRHNLGEGGGRGDKRASSSLNRANSLLSNLSARQARMVVTVPGPGSCSSDASCLMVVNTNCSVGCQRGRGKRKQHKQDKSIYTHATQGSLVPIAGLSASHLSNNYWICTFLHMRDVGTY